MYIIQRREKRKRREKSETFQVHDSMIHKRSGEKERVGIIIMIKNHQTVYP